MGSRFPVSGFLLGWLVVLDLISALKVLAPGAGQQVPLGSKFEITWERESGDPDNISIDLLNETAVVSVPVLENIAHNLNVSAGAVNVTWPYNVPNITAPYELYFIATASGDDIANSPLFNLTVGSNGRGNGTASGTVGPYGTHPSTDYPSTAASQGLSRGAIAGIVVGCVVVLALCGLAVIFYVRRRRRNRRSAALDIDEKHHKPELDATETTGTGHRRNKTLSTILSSELDSSAYSDKKERIDSGELEGDTKDYLHYELPSTPPPVELADNDVPAAEMPSPDFNRKVSSETSRIGDWPLREHTISPVPQRPGSVRSGRDSMRSGSTTLGSPQLSFAEALHEIVSQELRRKE